MKQDLNLNTSVQRNYVICPPDLEFEVREWLQNYFRGENPYEIISDATVRETLIAESNILDVKRMGCNAYLCVESPTTYSRLNGLWHYTQLIKLRDDEGLRQFEAYCTIQKA